MSHQDPSSFLRGILDINRYPKFYEVLECEVDCSQSTIKDQYRILSLRHHPDRGGSTEKMSKINEAYFILSDPTKRKIYDTLGSDFIIEEFERYYYFHGILLDYLPIYSTAVIISFLNIKDISLYYSSGDGNGEILPGIGFLHVLGFPLVHHFLEGSISKLFKRVGFIDQDIDYNYNPKNEEVGINKIKQYIKVNNIIPEVIASFISAPLEVAACNAYLAKYKIQRLSDFFTFSQKNSNIAILLTNLKSLVFQPQNDTLSSSTSSSLSSSNKLFQNIKAYFKTYQISYKNILGFVGSRVGFIILMDFLSYYSDYYHHQFLEIQEIYHYTLLYKDIVVDEFKKRREEGEIINQIQSRNIDNNNNDDSSSSSEDDSSYCDNDNDNNDDNDYNSETDVDEIAYENHLLEISNKKEWYKCLSWIFYIGSYCLPGLLFNTHRLLLGGQKRKIFSLHSLAAAVANGFSLFIFDQTCKQLGRITQKTNLLIKDFLDVVVKSK
ncbi:hypothetical protein ACTFIU_004173 [Dictyostelium citrinum]